MLQEFQRIGRLLFQEGLIDSHGGNMSLREGDKIFITRRDAMLGDLKDGDIIEVRMEPGEGDSQASRELPTHRAVYKQCDARALIHAHPANAIAISITDNKIVPQDAEGLFIYKSAPIVRVRDGIGSEETVRLLPTFLGRENVVAVVKGHGSFAVGKNLEEAYKYTSSLENSCRVIVAVRASGGRSQVNKPIEERRGERRRQPEFKSAIPPGIGVMDRSRYHKR
ncbi:MAG: class II aldolase/adducin family protein [Candidatus Margulisbacteria bacterium]|nr:class II aldolase/adducin family protein [Candidatus Margulisiibacteriota bacterium]